MVDAVAERQMKTKSRQRAATEEQAVVSEGTHHIVQGDTKTTKTAVFQKHF